MKKVIIILLNLIFAFVFSQFVFAADPAEAPLNPGFIQYLEDFSEGKIHTQSAGGHSTGYIPPTVDLAHLKGQQITWPFSVQAFDASYDLRNENKLTAVRNQGAYGTCWAHASMASLESCLMPTETWDFSENNMVNKDGFDWDYSDGGNQFMSTAYLVRWLGPVNETDDPYPTPNSTPSSPAGLSLKKHVQEVLFLPTRSSYASDPTANDTIKQAVISYGAVYTSLYTNGGSIDSYYNSTNHAYYYSGSAASDHTVAIVGWDDNYSSSNFVTAPAGNGAFLAKNSWGTAWGDDGYFYISYYDSVIGTGNAVFNNAESITNYYKIYQYDPLGWINSYGYSSTTGWFGNIFTATGTESLKAVGFYTGALNSSYDIYIHQGGTSETTPIDGTLVLTQSGTIAVTGYHTIVLDTPIALVSGQKFSIIVKLTTPGFNYPIPIEYPYYNSATGEWWSSEATANTGESFVSSNGLIWSDIADQGFADHIDNCNVCLKAYAGSDDTTAPSNITAVNDGIGTDIDTVNSRTTLSANWPASTDTGSGIARYWYGIGTTAGDTDVVSWTDVGVSTYVVKAGLTLIDKTKYYFTVKAENGAGLLSAVTNSDGQTVALANNLSQVYSWPNPVNPKSGQAITINELPLDKTITIKIYTLTGELVRTLNDGEEIVTGTATWDGKNEGGEYVASGVYLYVVDSGDEQKVGKIAIVK
ncbi:MAG: lectin like domain-containing protein [bacterium]|nr:lectin like domain-containing protein [bacterium]MDD5354572.1 lectin like domain-containing protein [bacterium]MDD5757174.1 lectin like domain-containing protein [bacterium]